MSNGKLVCKSELAELFGISERTVTTYQKNGLPIENDGARGGQNSYNTRDVIEWFVEFRVAKLISEKPGSGRDPEVDINPNSLEPQDRLAWYRSERERLNFEQETGELVHEKDHNDEMFKIGKAFVLVMETLPDQLERDCGLPPAAVAKVQSSIDDLRDQLAEMLASDEL